MDILYCVEGVTEKAEAYTTPPAPPPPPMSELLAPPPATTKTSIDVGAAAADGVTEVVAELAADEPLVFVATAVNV
jgi:hypothetical protein